jgi:hypothetical protein
MFLFIFCLNTLSQEKKNLKKKQKIHLSLSHSLARARATLKKPKRREDTHLSHQVISLFHKHTHKLSFLSLKSLQKPH